MWKGIMKLMFKPTFILIGIGTFLINMAYFVPLFYIPDMAVFMGVERTKANFLLSIFGKFNCYILPTYFSIKYVIYLCLLVSNGKYYWQTQLWLVIGQELCQFFVGLQHLYFPEWNHHIFHAILPFSRIVCCCHFCVWIFLKCVFP